MTIAVSRRLADYFVVVGLGNTVVAIEGEDNADAYADADKLASSGDSDGEFQSRSRSSSQWGFGDGDKPMRIGARSLRAVVSGFGNTSLLSLFLARSERAGVAILAAY